MCGLNGHNCWGWGKEDNWDGEDKQTASGSPLRGLQGGREAPGVSELSPQPAPVIGSTLNKPVWSPSGADNNDTMQCLA